MPRCKLGRRSTPRLLALGAGVLLAMLLGSEVTAGIRVCDRPADRPLPARVQQLIDAPDVVPDVPYGYGALIELLRQNRRDVEAGRITPAEAEARGGTRITGNKDFPVFPYLYSNSGAAPFSQADLEDQLFTGPWATGTMKEYFQEISYGLFSVGGYVDNWFTLTNDDDYYEGTNNGLDPGTDRTDELIIEILDARDGAIDFSQWDNDGPDGNPNSGDDNGYVDFIMFVTPDPSGSCGGNDNIWSHKSSLSNWTGTYYETDDAAAAPGVANIRINGYFISAGIDCNGIDQRGIGTHSHEFGHVLGIADLYDVGGGSKGLGYWCVMAGGNNNTQNRPAHMCAWAKERLGWLSYFNVNQKQTTLCLPPVERNPVAVRMWTEGAESQEYFVVENRQRIGFDDELEGTGLVIYHVDEAVYDAQDNTNTVNSDEAHKAIDVECADATTAGHVANADDLDAEVNSGDDTDPWCPSTQTTFNGATVPDSRSYSGAATDVSVSNINSCGPGQICATYSVGLAFNADLCMHDCAGDGCAEITTCSQWWGSPDIWIDNDDDGGDDYPADGIDNHLWCRVENTGPSELAAVAVDLYYSDPAMGQLWPSTGTLIGTVDIPILGPGDVAEEYVVFEYPDPPALVDHYCIGAVARHPLDPQNSQYPPNDDNVAQVNHQVLVARAGGDDDDTAVCPGSFLKRSRIYLMAGQSDTGGPVFAEVRRGTPPTFSDWNVPANWNLSITPPGPFTLVPGQRDSIFVTMTSANATDGQTAHLPLTLWDLQRQRAVGGVILDYDIDCFDPGKPLNGTATWLVLPPDYLTGPTVKVEWDPVSFDVGGGSERIKHYLVYRSDDQGTPEALVDQVAIDAEPGEPGFQWYDDLVKTCDVIYYYRIRAVDTAGALSDYSDALELSCPVVAVDGEALSIEGPVALRSLPNPFNPSTAIRYALAEAGRVELAIFDAGGKLVRRLVDAERTAGWHEAIWDGTGADGRPLPSGVYFARIETPVGTETRQLVLAR